MHIQSRATYWETFIFFLPTIASCAETKLSADKSLPSRWLHSTGKTERQTDHTYIYKHLRTFHLKAHALQKTQIKVRDQGLRWGTSFRETFRDSLSEQVTVAHTHIHDQMERAKWRPERWAILAEGTENIKTLRQEQGGHIQGTTRGSGWLEYSVRRSGDKWGRKGRQEPERGRPSKPWWVAWVVF